MKRVVGGRARRSAGALAVAALLLGLLPSTAGALPSDAELFSDNFESENLDNWRVTTAVNGTATVLNLAGHGGTRGARLTVPDYDKGSIAFLRRQLEAPVYGLSAAGNFKVDSGGCSEDAGYSKGNVPFFRFFDANYKRVVGLYRINGSCSKTAKLYVQHSGNFYRTGKNISFGTWYKAELRASVSQPSGSLVQVYLDDRLVYESTTADNGLRPFASVTIHNEHTNQVGDLVADNIRLGSFPVTPPQNPCSEGKPAPSNADPGTVSVADNFESFEFNQWTRVTREGDAIATIEREDDTRGCVAKLKVTANSGSMANLSKTLAPGANEVWAHGQFNVTRPGTNTSSNVPLFRLFQGSSRIVDVYRSNSNGSLFLRVPNGSGGWSFVSLGRTLQVGTWYDLKLRAVANGSSEGLIEVWLNGTKLAPVAAKLGVVGFDTAMVGSEHFAQEGDLSADDVIVKTLQP